MIRIYLLDRGISAWLWLCDICLKRRKQQGWEVRESKTSLHDLDCDDCRARKEKAA